MTRMQKIGAASGVALILSGVAGFAGYSIGKRYGHELIGGALGFFLAGPSVSTPVFLFIAGDAIREMAAEQAAVDTARQVIQPGLDALNNGDADAIRRQALQEMQRRGMVG